MTVFAGPPNAVAQSANTKWYEIELIVFARGADDRGQTEEWKQDPLIPDWPDTTPLMPRFSRSDLGVPGIDKATKNQLSINMVARSEYRLTGAKQRLEQTAGRLQPLLHLAWRQPTTTRKKAEWLYLQAPFENSEHLSTRMATGVIPPRLEGAIKISLSRYLHMDIDLLLREAVAQNEASTEYYQTMDYSPFLRYRMQAHRRMRSNELHYIDHPLMGILVQITPYQAPEPTPEPETETEPAPATPTAPESSATPVAETPAPTEETDPPAPASIQPAE